MPQLTHPFNTPGRFWRGNLHTHTTRSDGRAEPKDAVAAYADAGFDFVVLTDHRRIPEPEDLVPPREGFLVIPGTELDFIDRETGLPYHIVCIGVDETIVLPKEVTVQEAVDQAAAGSDLVYLAHPYWFGHDFDAFQGIKGHSGIEVYNATCEYLCGKGLSSAYLDAILKHEPIFAFAADDTHWSRPDFNKGWVHVKAEELTRESITTALKNGQFYSSTGPSIKSIEFDGERLTIETSPVDRIALIGPGTNGHVIAGQDGDLITSAEFDLRGHIERKTRYLRLQATDQHNNSAWTNPVMWNG